MVKCSVHVTERFGSKDVSVDQTNIQKKLGQKRLVSRNDLKHVRYIRRSKLSASLNKCLLWSRNVTTKTFLCVSSITEPRGLLLLLLELLVPDYSVSRKRNWTGYEITMKNTTRPSYKIPVVTKSINIVSKNCQMLQRYEIKLYFDIR